MPPTNGRSIPAREARSDQAQRGRRARLNSHPDRAQPHEALPPIAMMTAGGTILRLVGRALTRDAGSLRPRDAS